MSQKPVGLRNNHARARPGMRRNVLVVDVNAIGMVAVIRSLGRAGYNIHAIASQRDALGLYSRFTHHTDCNPPLDSASYLPWLREYIRSHGIEAIIPSEGFLHAIDSAYEEFAPLLPDSVPASVWQRCLSKVATQQWLMDASPASSRNMPAGGIMKDAESIPGKVDLAGLDGPFFVKAEGAPVMAARAAQVIRCETVAQLSATARGLLPGYEALVWQNFAPGKKVGVSLWRHNGKFMAQNMTLGIHMQPWTGGMMSLRESFWHEALLADARNKLEVLEWQGVAMMEYKWDPVNDQFWFIEINARYWGYLHLDLYAGKDFPKLQVDAFFGNLSEDMEPPAKKFACRHTVPGEIGYVMSRIRASDIPVWPKVCSIGGFFFRFLNLRTKSDLWYPGDRLLYWRSWLNYLRKLVTH